MGSGGGGGWVGIWSNEEGKQPYLRGLLKMLSRVQFIAKLTHGGTQCKKFK
jgi:hypothetical protein